jgi:hypothetical protein
MHAPTDGATDRASWRRYFAEILISGDQNEVDAATDAALAALDRGADQATVRAAGKTAARRHRESARSAPGNRPPTAEWSAPGATTTTTTEPITEPTTGAATAVPPPPAAAWSEQLAPPSQPELPRRPAWVEPPRPDAGPLHASRSRAVSKLVWRVAFAVVAVVAFTTYQVAIKRQVSGPGRSDAELYGVTVLAVAIVLAIGVVRSSGAVGHASRTLRAFEQPYRTMRAEQYARHRDALEQWEHAKRRHAAAAAEAAGTDHRLLDAQNDSRGN